MPDVVSRQPFLNPSLTAGLSFVVAFCSLAYQLLIARSLSQFEDNDILVLSLTIGLHLLFMGAGSMCSAKIRPFRDPLHNLIALEALLALLGACCLHALTAWSIFSELTIDLLPFSSAVRLAGLIAPIALIGFLSGFEVPWLIEAAGRNGSTRILGWNYLGAFSAAILTPIALIPALPLVGAAIAVSLLNLCAILALLPAARLKLQGLCLVLVAFVVIVAGQQGVLATTTRLEQTFLKTSYLEIRLESWTGSWRQWWLSLEGFRDIERYVSPYQMIDLIPDGFMLSEPRSRTFAMYLNMQPQFSSDNIALYHESMVHGGIALAGGPARDVLVLGGGDGLLVRELLRRRETRSITLVELDPLMLHLARTHPRLLELNHHSLQDNRVRVVEDDAFAWIRRQSDQWDAVFIDFPFPVTYELGKLYSVEFYEAVKRRLRPGGYFVLDAPIWNTTGDESPPSPTPQEILFSTLHEAGMKNTRLFGPYEPFLVATLDEPNEDFIEDRFDGVEISNKTSMNLTLLSRLSLESTLDERWINRVFKPRRMRW